MTRLRTPDGNGFYSLPGAPRSSGPAGAAKLGHASDLKDVTIRGDTRLDLQLVRAEFALRRAARE